MDELQQEQFTKALLGLVDLAKTKKNVLQYGEINDAFKGLELTCLLYTSPSARD